MKRLAALAVFLLVATPIVLLAKADPYAGTFYGACLSALAKGYADWRLT